MAEAADRIERHRAILGELAELGLALARDFQARALASDDADEAQKLGLAFQRVSRAVRQTIALEQRVEQQVEREAARDQAAAREHFDAQSALQTLTAREARKERVRQVLAAEIDAEFTPDTPDPQGWRERLFDELEDNLADEEVQPDFGRELTEDETYLLLSKLRSRIGLFDPEPEGADDDPHITCGRRVIIFHDQKSRCSKVRKFLRKGWLPPRPALPARRIGDAGGEEENAPSTPPGSPSP